jgi:mannose-6-phosphate isomerase-like protein (cupin superfamily)
MVSGQSAQGSGFEFVRLWGGDSAPAFPDGGNEPDHKTYFPPVGGFRFGIFTVAPAQATAPASAEARKATFAEMGRLFPGLLQHMEASNPGMHTSDSIDFGYVISGSIWLELDDGSSKELHAGDTYVQNGTRHAWRNRSDKPCSILVALVGAQREPSGASIAAARTSR